MGNNEFSRRSILNGAAIFKTDDCLREAMPNNELNSEDQTGEPPTPPA